MPKIVSLHAFLHGVGKSTLTANLAVVLAYQGKRVGVIDADLTASGLHWLFDVDNGPPNLNTFLQGDCDILDTVVDVTPQFDAAHDGRVLFVPASDDPSEMARAARRSYSFHGLPQAADRLLAEFGLDVLLLDAPVGLIEDSLFLLGISDASAVVLRLDKQDYLGTSVMLEVARALNVPRLMLVVGLTPPSFSLAEVRSEMTKTYRTDLVAALPYSEELLALSGAEVFAARYPNHALTSLFGEVAAGLIR